MLFLQAIFIGVVATLIMDLLIVIRTRYFSIKSLNYAFVGRWILGWKDLQFRHQNITQAASQRGEAVLGWSMHYVIGIVWAYVLLLRFPDWINQISIWPVLLISIVTLIFPFMIMQPAFGFGFFAAKTPAPKKARINSLVTHLFFAAGLYSAGWIYSGVMAG